MIIDAHVHIFPPDLIADRLALAEREAAFAVIYGDPRARMVDAEGLIAALDEQGVDRAVVCGYPWRDRGLAEIHNDYIIDAARRYPDRLISTAGVEPLAPGAEAEAERALAAGADGLGELALYGADLSDPVGGPVLRRLAGLCAEADRPLLLHTNEPVGHNYPGKSPMTLAGLYNLLRDCPQTRFQLAHLGGGLFFYLLLKRETAEVMANAVFDTAAAPFLYRPELYSAFINLAGADRLLYGSDYPLLGLKRYLKDLDGDGVTGPERELILGDNAARFWRV